jgi:hypothetical protein
LILLTRLTGFAVDVVTEVGVLVVLEWFDGSVSASDVLEETDACVDGVDDELGVLVLLLVLVALVAAERSPWVGSSSTTREISFPFCFVVVVIFPSLYSFSTSTSCPLRHSRRTSRRSYRRLNTPPVLMAILLASKLPPVRLLLDLIESVLFFDEEEESLLTVPEIFFLRRSTLLMTVVSFGCSSILTAIAYR